MATTQKTLSDLRAFCLENGYLFSAYRQQGNGNYKLLTTEANDDPLFPDSMIILCEQEGTAISYRETVSEGNKFIFRIHNNYNLPRIIPAFP